MKKLFETNEGTRGSGVKTLIQASKEASMQGVGDVPVDGDLSYIETRFAWVPPTEEELGAWKAYWEPELRSASFAG